MKKLMFLGVVCAFLLLPMAALADSITPTSFTGTIAVGGSLTVHKTVTVSAGTPTEGQGDVFFLTDTTGSMGGLIDDVQTNATAILTGLSSYGNIQTGAGNYQDFPTNPWGGPSDYPYRLDAAIDGVASTQDGINNWALGWGNDGPESGIYALQQVATQAATGWRAGSEKFVLWFGDAPGHEPSSTPGYPGPSTADTIAALNAAGITVLAFDVGYGGYFDSQGQPSAITAATGGTLYAGYGTDIVGAILDAIEEAFETYTKVDIAAPSLAGLGISVVPTFYSGSWDRSEDRTFEFDVTFTGLAPGTYEFDLFGRVDGGNVASERDVITVTGTAVPEPATLLLLGAGLLGLAGFRRRLVK